jgi:hypothetical protein
MGCFIWMQLAADEKRKRMLKKSGVILCKENKRIKHITAYARI